MKGNTDLAKPPLDKNAKKGKGKARVGTREQELVHVAYVSDARSKEGVTAALQSLCENSAGLLQHMRERRCVLQGVREGSGAQALVFFDLDDKVSVRFLRTLREAHADALLIVTPAFTATTGRVRGCVSMA